jgi:hypothetical protein
MVWIWGSGLALAALLLLAWAFARLRRPAPADPALQRLVHSLQRQRYTPTLGSPRGSLLLPILAFELMSAPMRQLYDRSREADAALLALLLDAPQDMERRLAVASLQRLTREVRRRLLLALTEQDPDDPAEDLTTLARRLDVVEAAVERMRAPPG